MKAFLFSEWLGVCPSLEEGKAATMATGSSFWAVGGSPVALVVLESGKYLE